LFPGFIDQSVPSRQCFCPAKPDINQLLTFAVWLSRRMVNHDCDGHHKICHLLPAMPKHRSASPVMHARPVFSKRPRKVRSHAQISGAQYEICPDGSDIARSRASHYPCRLMGLDAGGTATGGGVRFLGQRRSYWRLLIRGAALLMLTLGIYRFWLVTDVRRFLWSNTEIAGEQLEYSGTPLELLLGFLIAIAILIPVYAGIFLAALDLGTIGKLSGATGFAALGIIGQYAIYRARRYRLTRTIFRGLRFHQEGSAWAFAFRAVAWWAVTALTLGLAYPFQVASLERYKMRHTYYGDLAGRFDASALRLLLRGFLMWILVIGPLAFAVVVFASTIDWVALVDVLTQGGG